MHEESEQRQYAHQDGVPIQDTGFIAETKVRPKGLEEIAAGIQGNTADHVGEGRARKMARSRLEAEKRKSQKGDQTALLKWLRNSIEVPRRISTRWALSSLSDNFLGRARGIAGALSRFGATHDSPITSVMYLAAASQGQWFAAAYRDSSNLFNVGKFSLDGALLAKQECAVTSSLAVAPDDSVVASASGRTVMLVDASKWSSVAKREVGDSAISSLTFPGQNRLLAIGEEGEIVCFWIYSSAQCGAFVSMPFRGVYTSMRTQTPASWYKSWRPIVG